MKRALAVLVLASVSACAHEAPRLRYAGTVEFSSVEVGSLVGGRVERVLRDEGDSASRGEVLVTLDPREWQSNLDEARALADATQRELDLLLAGARKEEIEEARAQAKRLELLWKVTAQGSRPEEIGAAREEVAVADAALVEAEKEVARVTDLVRRQVEPGATLDPAVAARDAAKARKAVAEQRLLLLQNGARPEEVEAARQAYLAQKARVDVLEAGSRPEEIAAKRATLEAARARMSVAESKLQELQIRAPADCFVQTLDLEPGDLIAPGAPVGVLLLQDAPWITVYVPERDLALVSVGRAARVLPDGHPELVGRVTWISRVAEFTPRNVQTREERLTQVFAVKVTIDGDVSRLKDGMWADVVLE